MGKECRILDANYTKIIGHFRRIAQETQRNVKMLDECGNTCYNNHICIINPTAADGAVC